VYHPPAPRAPVIGEIDPIRDRQAQESKEVRPTEVDAGTQQVLIIRSSSHSGAVLALGLGVLTTQTFSLNRVRHAMDDNRTMG